MARLKIQDLQCATNVTAAVAGTAFVAPAAAVGKHAPLRDMRVSRIDVVHKVIHLAHTLILAFGTPTVCCELRSTCLGLQRVKLAVLTSWAQVAGEIIVGATSIVATVTLANATGIAHEIVAGLDGACV